MVEVAGRPWSRSRLFGLVLVVCAGCSGPAQTTADGRPGFEFSSVVFEGQDSMESHAFKQNEVFVCMAAEGFDYVVEPFVVVDELELDSRERRSSDGFGISTDSQVRVEVEQSGLEAGVGDERERAAEQAALGRCHEDANEALNRRIDRFIGELEPDDRAVFDAVASFEHPLLTEAEAAWSSCMVEQGYPFITVAAMYEHMYQTFDSPDDLSAEIDLAVTDWDCSRTDAVYGRVSEAYELLDGSLGGSFASTLQ